MTYHFFSTKKNDVTILEDTDETDLLRKDADKNGFFLFLLFFVIPVKLGICI